MLTQRMPPEIHDAAALIQPQKLYDLATISPEESLKKSFPDDLTQALHKLAENVTQSTTQLVDRAYNYASERGAWMPIAEDQRTYRLQTSRLRALQSATDRVVNTGLRQGERYLRADEVLTPMSRYDLSVQIGRRSEWSVVQGSVALPEAALRRLYRDDGLQLRVVVFARSFELKEAEQILQLPPPPQESRELIFTLWTPKDPGPHRVRVCLYYAQNLLQSILIRTWVARPGGQPTRSGTFAEVEYALSGTLKDVELLPKRSVNVLLNQNDEGTHTLAIKGGKIREQFDFTEGEMRGAVTAARNTLVDVCADRSKEPPRYRFNDDNRGTKGQLADDLRRLAEFGYMLFTNIVTAKDRTFEAKLLKELGVSKATIQIAAVKAAQYVFPWALVYDHPIVAGSAKLCPQFEADLAVGQPGFLVNQRCMTQGCSHKEDTSIVCPSGFWGFKHFIEQPLSVSSNTPEGNPRNLVLEIGINRPDRRIPLLMAVSRDLKQVDDHQSDLKQYPKLDLGLGMKENKVEIGQNLKVMQAGLVYFYCHGGRDGSITWLGVGRKEKLYASDLNAWRLDWSRGSPLVFINGCHTADITPDDLLGFSRTLGYSHAAGMIGTEISVTETLARYVGKGLLSRVSEGKPVGIAMREQRLEMLERCNVLGLAYTPYCSSELAIKFS